MVFLRAIILSIIFGVFVIVFMSLIWVLWFIGEGEYKKAIIRSIFAVILTIIALAGILVAF